ncbi:MAG: dienelactone hydrolase family protein [Candidatus Aenigmarchaeota archaeon]|nr:dienelactone hydrolase family protein [Candidatus Aenigmarchaeota archaeon]
MEQAVKFPAKGADFNAFYCKPENPKAFVLVIHEVHGLSDKIKDICRLLAKNGYAAFAPNLWTREGTPQLSDHSSILRKLQDTSDQLMLEHLDDAILHLKNEGARKIVALGLGIGGTWAMLLASRHPDLAACIAFYGTLIREPGKLKKDPIDCLDDVKCPILFISGALDDDPVVVPRRDVERLAKAAQQKGIFCRTILLEKAGYAFCNPASKYYNKEFCNQALEQAVKFLEEKI